MENSPEAHRLKTSLQALGSAVLREVSYYRYEVPPYVSDHWHPESYAEVADELEAMLTEDGPEAA